MCTAKRTYTCMGVTVGTEACSLSFAPMSFSGDVTRDVTRNEHAPARQQLRVTSDVVAELQRQPRVTLQPYP
jgi:hypothetical protein